MSLTVSRLRLPGESVTFEWLVPLSPLSVLPLMSKPAIFPVVAVTLPSI